MSSLLLGVLLAQKTAFAASLFDFCSPCSTKSTDSGGYDEVFDDVISKLSDCFHVIEGKCKYDKCDKPCLEVCPNKEQEPIGPYYMCGETYIIIYNDSCMCCGMCAGVCPDDRIAYGSLPGLR